MLLFILGPSVNKTKVKDALSLLDNVDDDDDSIPSQRDSSFLKPKQDYRTLSDDDNKNK